jgi:hypothetical protein
MALDHLTHPVRFSLVGRPDDDPVPDMSLHGGLLGSALAESWLCSPGWVLCHSVPAGRGAGKPLEADPGI